MKTITSCALLMAATIFLASCSRSPKFAAFPIRVIDADTKQPITGVSIDTFCMGGTPYANDVYHTDANGMAKVMYREGAQLAGVRIFKEGHRTNFYVVSPTNFVVTLNRLK